MTVIKNVYPVYPNYVGELSDIRVEGKFIKDIIPAAGGANHESAQITDGAFSYASPGFIDLHCHGGGGYDFSDASVEAFENIAKFHASFGATVIYPTLPAVSRENMIDFLDAFESYESRGRKEGAYYPGVHMEGPYFSPSQKGAQDIRYIKEPDLEEADFMLSKYPFIKRWSSAPEIKGGLELGRILEKRGVLCSIAHSDAIYSQAAEAFNNGYTHITHLYSGMEGVRRINAFRFGGVVEAAFLIDGMTVEIIADGRHLPPELLKLIYKIKGPDATALVTDAIRAAGLPEGPSRLGSAENGQDVIIEDNVAKLPDRSAFAGSVATCDRLLRVMIQEAGVPLCDAVKMLTLTPAKIMGIQKDFGSLTSGKYADVVLFDKEINVSKVIIQGKIF